MDEEQMWTQLGIEAFCHQEECTTVVDGRYAMRGDRIAVEDGSFIQVFVGSQQEQISPRSEHEDDIVSRDITMEEVGEALSLASHTPSSSTISGQRGHLQADPTAALTIMLTTKSRSRLLGLSLFLAGSVAETFQLQVQRVGEALHPGPRFWIGATNPSGLRGKEESYFKLPTGLWGIAETHLTALNQRDATNIMRRLSLQHKRFLQLHHGAPVAPRSANSLAGTWSGVSVATDMACRPISIPWPQSEFTLGRIQMVQGWYGPFQVSGANLYGWPKSPTWPRAIEATEDMLTHLTKELVLSRTGPRFIVGDFNCCVDESPSVAIWKSQGWINAQDWAIEQLGREHTMTSKHVNVLDHIFVSPELAQFMRAVEAWDLFADHVAIGAEFEVPVAQVNQTVWPMPAYIPYNKVTMAQWHNGEHTVGPFEGNVDEQFQQFSIAFEESFTCCIDAPEGRLPPAMTGRGQRVQPEQRLQQCPLLKPSRPGEVQPVSDLLGRTVHKWFQQLRRMQSMLHSLKANKQTWDAWLYRAELWRAITRAKGFQRGFAAWWFHRPIQCHGSPRTWPSRVPTAAVMQRIFTDFEVNYRKFEVWHGRQRRDMLQLTLMENQEKVFSMVKPTGKAPLQHLEERWDRIIFGYFRESHFGSH